jgi:hypothetical protein
VNPFGSIPDEALRNGQYGEVALVQMDFGTGTRRWWTGFGDRMFAGETWQGVGDLITISSIVSTYDVQAEPVTFEMAATAEMVRLARNAAKQVHGRDVTVWGQLFATVDPDGRMPWQPVGERYAHFVGSMGAMTYEKQGPTQRNIRLVCEGLWARLNAPPYGQFTDRDQQSRNPGDKGAERVGLYGNYETKWT